MPYYVDLWRWLGSTFNWVRPGPSKDLSLHKIKGGQGVCQTKANSEGQPRSWTRRFTLRQPSECRTMTLWHLSYIWQLVNSVSSKRADAHIMAVHHLTNYPLIWFDCRHLYLCSVSNVQYNKSSQLSYNAINTLAHTFRPRHRQSYLKPPLYFWHVPGILQDSTEMTKSLFWGTLDQLFFHNSFEIVRWVFRVNIAQKYLNQQFLSLPVTCSCCFHLCTPCY